MNTNLTFAEDNKSWELALPKPEPSLGTSAYVRERRLSLAKSPRRLINYIKYQRSERNAHLNYLPIKLDIENVSRCNFHCIMCQVSDWPKLKRAEDMSFEDFKMLIDSQYGLVEIKIQGMGEPTLAGDDLFRMIRYARSKHIWVRTITNASILHINNNYRKIIDSGVNEVQISIDGASKEVFESIRCGSRFEKVVENCKLINEYANAKGVSPAKMWVVVQQKNFHELFSLVDLAGRAGFRSLVFSLELQGWGQDKWNEYNAGLSVSTQMAPRLAQELIERGITCKVKVAFWMATSKYHVSTLSALCPWPFERAYVSSDLRIVPCCMIGNPETSDLGDAREFAREWHSSVYRKFRQAHLDGCVPSVCRECYGI